MPETRRSRSIAVGFLVLTAAWTGAIAWLVRDYFVDDAYITFRFVENLWLGNGFVFNPPERVEGLTNLGWALLLVPFGGFIAVPAAAKVIGLLAFTLGLWLVWRIGRRLFELDPLLAPVVLLATAASVEYLYFSLSGMETGLAALLGLVAIGYLQRRPDGLAVVAWLAAGLFLVRPEYLVVFPLYLGLRLLDRRRRGTGSAFLVYLGLVIAATLARLAYFGSPLPVTASSKSTRLAEIAGRALDSLTQANPNLPPPFTGVLAVALMALGAAAWHRRQPEPARFAAALVSAALLFATYAPSDWTHLGRYFAPAVPVAMLLLATGCRTAVLRILPAKTEIQATVAFGLILALAIGGLQRTLRVLSPEQLDRFPGLVMTSESLIEPSRWIASHVSESSVIATRRIGALGFIARRHIYDYKFGLTDATVARIVARHGPLDDPRHPALEESWLAHSPDFILEDVSTLATWAGPRGEPSEILVHGTLYRELRRFPIGEETEWSLLEAVPQADPGDG